MNESDQEDEKDETEYESAETTIEFEYQINESDRTNDELDEILIEPEPLLELIGMPHDLVKAFHVELIVTNNQPVRLDYALVVDSDHDAQCTTETPLLPDQGAELHFGYIQYADKVVRRNDGIKLSPDQTASLYRSLDLIPDQKAQFHFRYIQPADEVVRRNDGSRLSPDLSNLIPSQANPLLVSLILSINEGFPPHNGSDIVAQMSPTAFRERERQNNPYNFILKCTATIVIIGAACWAAHRMKKEFSARKLWFITF